MKINLDYIRKITTLFIESPTASITYLDFEKSGLTLMKSDSQKLDDEFLFHISLFIENRLISNEQLEGNTLKNIGIHVGTPRNSDVISIIPIRLTQKGHDFTNMLNQNEVFEKLKANFKEAPFEVMLNAGKTLATAFAKKKLEELTGFTE